MSKFPSDVVDAVLNHAEAEGWSASEAHLMLRGQLVSRARERKSVLQGEAQADLDKRLKLYTLVGVVFNRVGKACVHPELYQVAGLAACEAAMRDLVLWALPDTPLVDAWTIRNSLRGAYVAMSRDEVATFHFAGINGSRADLHAHRNPQHATQHLMDLTAKYASESFKPGLHDKVRGLVRNSPIA